MIIDASIGTSFVQYLAILVLWLPMLAA